jgi:cathepsin X
MEKHTKRQFIRNKLPYTKFSREIDSSNLRIRSHSSLSRNIIPKTFNWQNFDSESHLTRSLNQHLPVYCGSGWAHAAVSVIADRIKMIRLIYLKADEDVDDDDDDDEEDEFHDDGFYPDVSLSVQFLLNCGGEIAGSCQGGEISICGHCCCCCCYIIIITIIIIIIPLYSTIHIYLFRLGSATGAFQFIKEIGYIPFESCQPYMACSSDSDEEFCQHVDTTCTPINICKTCTHNLPHGTGSTCNQVSQFPHARIDEYGIYKLDEANDMDDHIFMVKAEISSRGPVTAGIAAHHLKNYTGGILYDDESLRDIEPTHEVSIIGWEVDDETGVEYWIIRNSWGEYWGEMSFFRLQLGTNMLGVEKEISWVTIKDFSIENVPCYQDARNCNLAAMNFIPGVGEMSCTI